MARNLRLNVARASLAVGACLLAGSLLFNSLAPDDAPTHVALGILTASRDGSLRLPSACYRDAEEPSLVRDAAWLRWVTLSRVGQTRLLDVLEAVADSFEARLHPLAVDLSEEPPETSLSREASWFIPSWTTAKQLVRSCFVSPDEATVVITPPLDGRFPPHTQTFDPWARVGANPLERQARFLSWPISSSIYLKQHVKKAPESSVDELRQLAETAPSLVALV